MLKNILRRTVSTFLALTMIVTMFSVIEIIDPSSVLPTAEAAVTATDPTYGELYFIVPEAIYLKPKYNSYTASTSSTFQWYVNNTLQPNGSVTLDTGESATGAIAFRYSTATNVRVSFKWQSTPGTDMTATGTITYGGSAVSPGSTGYLIASNGTGSTTITAGNSPSLSASATGAWICWTATYTDSADGQTKEAYAYTYVYKPYVAPIAVGVKGRSTYESTFNASYLSWISGVHGVKTLRSGYDGDADEGSGSNYYPKTGTDHGFLPFSSSDTSGVECEGLNLMFSSRFYSTPSNENPTLWASSSGTDAPNKSVYILEGIDLEYGSGSDYVINYAYSSTGMLTVDKSRYTNLDQVPNLTVGLMVTNDQGSSAGGAWFMTNFTGHNSTFDQDFTDYWDTGTDTYRATYWNPLYNGATIRKEGNWNSQNVSQIEGVKANSRWSKSLSSTSSGVFYVGTGYANHKQIDPDSGDTYYIYDTAELRCNVELFDKSDLRSAYVYAQNAFPSINTTLFDTTSTQWKQFIGLYNAVAQWLCKVDCGSFNNMTVLGTSYATVGELSRALKDKTDDLKSMSNAGRLGYTATQRNVYVYAGNNGSWTLASYSDATAQNYHKGAQVVFTPANKTGYTCKGYVEGYKESQTTAGNATTKQASDMQNGSNTVAHATGALTRSYYYLRDVYSITYTLNGGSIEQSNPTTYTVESSTFTLHNPVKAGYTFTGWTGSNGSTPKTTVTIANGSTGNKSYTANWTANEYTVHYNGNGATWGEMTDSLFTYDQQSTLRDNNYIREYYPTYHLGYNDATGNEIVEQGWMTYSFDGWNTAANGSGASYTNQQSVSNMTTGFNVTLYAQWTPSSYTLPSPERFGYGFSGWYADPACTQLVGPGGASYAATSDIDLYGKWTENSYTIRYNGNGSTGGSTPTSTHRPNVPKALTTNGFERKYIVTFETNGGTLDSYTKTSTYDFLYWNGEPDGSGSRNFIDGESVMNLLQSGTLDLYAQWTDDNATIVLDSPLRDGYTFLGWYTDPNFAAGTEVVDTILPTANTTLYAKWAMASYTITLNTNGGEPVSPTTITYVADNPEGKTLPETTRAGYTLDGWRPITLSPNDDIGNWNATVTYAAGMDLTGMYGDVTLMAQWLAIRYAITFDTNGGNAYPNLEGTKTYTIQTTDSLGTPTREGFTFTNWTVKTSGGNWGEVGTVYNASDHLNGKYGDVELLAHWSAADYEISFDANGGDSVANLPYNADSTDVLPETTYTGYTFLGWKPEESAGSWNVNTVYAAGTSLTGKYGSVKLIAQWSETQYHITFNENGGADVSDMIYDVTVADMLPSTARTAYTFSGWKPEESSGSWDENTVYDAGAYLTGRHGDVTLIAQWTPVVYTITFDPNGGDNYPADSLTNTMTYTIVSAADIGEPVKAGFVFAGWTLLSSDSDCAYWQYDAVYPAATQLSGKYGNVSLQAQWEVEQYNINYDYRGGTVAQANPTVYTVESGSITLHNPTKRGYNFTGWTGSNGSVPQTAVTIAAGSTGDKSYTANYSLSVYSISCDLAGGNVESANPTTYTIEDNAITLNNPTRFGYNFAGWTGTDLTEPTMSVTIENGSTGNREYTATWTPIEYDVTYDLAGGSMPDGVTNPATYTIKTAPFTLNNPTKDGYTFTGWTGDNGTTPQTTVLIPTGSFGGKSFTANWAVAEYTITYDLAGGSLPDGVTNPTTYMIESESITLQNPTRTGYTFDGWTGTDLTEPSVTVTIAAGSTGDRIYSATWSADTFTISYDLDGGEAVNPTTYTIETAAFNLNNPTKTGYTFAGWTGTDLSEATTTVTITNGSTGDRSYTATWTPKEYQINYVLDGGTQSLMNPSTYTIETETFQLDAPTRDGFTFEGWTGSNGSVPETTVFIEKGSFGDKTFTANWSIAVPYSITYDLAGGEMPQGVSNPTTYTVNNTFVLNNPIRPGYTFTGWTGTDVDYPQTTVIISNRTGDLFFVANWAVNTYIVKFVGGAGANGSMSDVEYTYDETYVLPANIFTKKGCSFAGWALTSGGEVVYTDGAPVSNLATGGQVNLYAAWENIDYTLTFNTNGATSGSVSDLHATYGQTVSLPDGADLVCYSDLNAESRTFLGWDLDGTFYEAGADFECPSQNVTFTAVWSANYYDLDALVALIESYRTNNAVPANNNDPLYKAGGAYAVQLGSGGNYPWSSYDMTGVEEALAQATAAANRDLPQDQQASVNGLYADLRNALNAIALLPADADKLIDCEYSGSGFHDSFTDNVYPPCESGTKHSYNSLLTVLDALFAEDADDCLYTAASVQALHDYVYGNGSDVTGVVTQVANAALKKPAQSILDDYVRGMAQVYHTTPVLKGADYTNLDKLITEYLPGLHNDVEAGQGVEYANLASYYSAASVNALTEYYENISSDYKNVEQQLLEVGGDVYDGLKDKIDALVPLDADYTDVFSKILTIPSGTAGFSYPAAQVTSETYPTWIAWAQSYSGGVSTQMDTVYLASSYTNSSVAALYSVLNNIEWDRNVFQQADVNGVDNASSYSTLLDEAISGLTHRTYAVTYMYNNGTNEVFTIESGYHYGDCIGSFPSDPERTGYIFKGWSADSSGTIIMSEENVVKADMTLYAMWMREYTITYILNGGTETGENPTTYTVESDAFTLFNPVRTGYAFAGWTGTGLSEATLEVTIEEGSAGNRTYTATWTLTVYTISYDLAGGAVAVENPTTYTVETAAFTLNNPIKAGYVFTGWTASGSATPQQVVTIEKGTTGNKSYTANWTPAEYEIAYILNGGTAYNPTAYTIESEEITLQTPVRTGYDFTGWEGTDLAAPTTTVTIPTGSYGDRAYTATWSIHTYSIRYYDEDGTTELTDLTPTSYTVETVTFTLAQPTREGFSFVGWTGDNGTTPQTSVAIERGSVGDRVYTAHWSAAAYMISYDLNGGTMPEGVENPSSYSSSSSAIVLNNPVRAGYRFTGWTGTDLSGKTMEVTIPTGSSGNRSYTATWKIVTYLITYDLDGGALDDEEENEEFYTILTASFTLYNPTRMGYDFAGWTGTDLAEPTVDVTIAKGSTGDREYTATWAPIEYTMTYDLDGGSMPEGVTNPAFYTIETETFTLNAPVKSGCTFVGWTGTGLAGETIDVTIAKGSMGARSFTANWSASAYSITYDLAGGAVAVANPTSYLPSTPTFTLNNPVRAGYEFAGWTGTGLSGATKTVTIESGSAGNRSYTATWNAIEYTISYDLDEGELPEGVTNPSAYTIESETFTLNNPTKTGFVFVGWTGADLVGPTMNVTIEKGSIGNRIYTAHWDTSVFTITYDLAGGTLAVGNPTSFLSNTETFTLNNPTMTGYDFAGWIGTGLAEPTITVTIEKGSMGSRSYTATWAIHEYAITYDLDGGSLAFDNPETYTIEDYAITLENPTKRGYTFEGWTGTDLTEPTKEVTIESGSTGDRSYKANFNARTYTISYTLNGGAVAAENPTTYTVETETFTLNNPVLAGYTFTGWTGSNSPTPQTEVTIEKGSIGNKFFTANWAAAEYAITYDLAGGSLADNVTNPTSYTFASSDITLNNPTRDGYYFAGWTGTDLAEPTMTVTIASGSMGERSYTATWTPVGYTISYDLNGGTANNPTTYTGDGADITLENPTRAGYDFIGWTGSNGATPQTTVTIPTGSSGDKSYTANWAAIEYAISYDPAGGTFATANPTVYTIETGSFTLNNPEMTGYVFVGWTGTDIPEGDTWLNVQISVGSMGERSYTAVWSPIEYAITYDLAGGAVAAENPTSYTVESEAFTLNNPIRRGYAFKGWTGTGLSAPATEVTIESGSTGARSYTATWEIETYAITCDPAGGTLAAENPASYTVETETFILNNPTRTGYTFAGWTGSNGDTPQTTVAVAAGSVGDRAYTAVWTAIEYAISYDLDGGSAENPTVYTIATETFTLNNPTRAGYAFVGWTGTDLAEATTTVTIAKGSMGERSYTAHWTSIGYGISYDLAGGELPQGVTNPTFYSPLDEDIVLNNPIRAGYDFIGWTGSNGTVPQTTVTILTASSASDMFYTANWSAVEYAIEYVLNGGAVALDNPTVYTIESETFTLNNPTRAGYTFTGWTGTEIAGSAMEVTVAKGSTGDRSYTATWNIVDYTIGYDLAGGSVKDANPTHYTVETASFTLNNPTKTGYTFKGWTGSNGDTPQTTVTIESGSTGDMFYTANWTAIEYNITYILAGGTAAEGNPTRYSAESDAITLNNPTRLGYNFAGWTGTGLSQATMEVVIPTGSRGDRSYTATWTLTVYTIDYDLQGGEFEDEMPTTYTIMSYDITLSDPFREGYEFLGWTSEDIDEPQMDVTIVTGSTGNLHFTAHWSGSEYTVRYNGNGATGGSMSNQTFTFDTYGTLAANRFVRTGYTFEGWALTKNGSVAAYEDGAQVINLTQTNGAIVNLYAVWSARTFTVMFDLNGAAGEHASQSVTMDGDAVALRAYEQATTIIDGVPYAFVGWAYTEADANSGVAAYGNAAPFAVNAAVLQAAQVDWSAEEPTITLYAVWENACEHNYEAVVTPVTCTTDGYTTYTCTLCGDVKVEDVIPATGHNKGDAVAENYVPETCLSEGSYDRVVRCTVCGAELSREKVTIPVGDHTAAEPVIEANIEPTCVTNGSYDSVVYCSVCGEELSRTIVTVPATGVHDWGDWEVVTPATTTEEGLESRTCKCCGLVETRAIDILVSKFVVSAETARPGKTVSVTVSIENNPGIISAMLHIGYDPQILTLVNVENSGLFAGADFTPGSDLTQIPYTVSWLDPIMEQNFTQDGVLVTLTFLVAEDAPEGETPITVTYTKASTLDLEQQQMEFALMDGSVFVDRHIPGDANRDGVVDVKDIVYIERFIAGGWNITIDERAADVDGSGTVTLLDAALIARYLVGGWGVTLI